MPATFLNSLSEQTEALKAQGLFKTERLIAGPQQADIDVKSNGATQHVLNLFRRKGLNPTVAHRAATLEIQRSLAAHGEGIAISYASPNNSTSYDNRTLLRLPILDKDAAEPVVLARHGTGPVEATLASAERILFDALSETRPEVSCEDG